MSKEKNQQTEEELIVPFQLQYSRNILTLDSLVAGGFTDSTKDGFHGMLKNFTCYHQSTGHIYIKPFMTMLFMLRAQEGQTYHCLDTKTKKVSRVNFNDCDSNSFFKMIKVNPKHSTKDHVSVYLTKDNLSVVRDRNHRKVLQTGKLEFNHINCYDSWVVGIDNGSGYQMVHNSLDGGILCFKKRFEQQKSQEDRWILKMDFIKTNSRKVMVRNQIACQTEKIKLESFKDLLLRFKQYFDGIPRILRSRRGCLLFGLWEEIELSGYGEISYSVLSSPLSRGNSHTEYEAPDKGLVDYLITLAPDELKDALAGVSRQFDLKFEISTLMKGDEVFLIFGLHCQKKRLISALLTKIVVNQENGAGLEVVDSLIKILPCDFNCTRIGGVKNDDLMVFSVTRKKDDQLIFVTYWINDDIKFRFVSQEDEIEYASLLSKVENRVPKVEYVHWTEKSIDAKIYEASTTIKN